jgi:crotonobetainyl-CoA:carnitine CoA-transferase CaiB-like acyl-CoA transferase
MQDFDAAYVGPLDGVRVLDLSRLVAGNMVSLQLADYGAEVIKVEPVGDGDPLRHWMTDGIPVNWKVYARNKKSLSLNLRDDEAKQILLRLVESADVMIENYRPGTLEKMGLGPDVLMARNKKLILVRDGAGQIIDLSLLEPMHSILGAEAAWHKVTGSVRDRVGSGSNTSSPRNVYATKDGKWLAMSGSMQSMAERIFRTIGRPDMVDDPKYKTNGDRVKNRKEVDEIVGGWIGARSLDDCMEIFERESVTVAPVYDIEQIVHDPHFQEREIIVDLPDAEMGTVPMHNIVPRLSGTPGGFKRKAPDLGEHNGEILGALGYSDEEIDNLAARGAI